MATALVIGACGYSGSTWRACSSPVTGPAKRWFKISVNQSCSGMNCASGYWLLASGFQTLNFTTRSISRYRLEASSWQLEAAFQSDPRLIGGFASDGSHGQEQARK